MYTKLLLSFMAIILWSHVISLHMLICILANTYNNYNN